VEKHRPNFFRYGALVNSYVFHSTQSNQSPAREPSKSASLVQKSAKTTTSQLLIAAAHFTPQPYTGCIEYCQLQARLLPGSALIPGGCCLIAVLNMTLKLIWDEPDQVRKSVLPQCPT